MKRLILPVFAVSALLLSSCSTTQLARQADNSDDVYYTEAKAKIVTPVVYTQTDKQEQTYRTDEQLYGDEQYSDNRFEDDYSYSARINRFYYNSPYRPYYDYRYSYGYNPWYTYSYDPFFYDPWLYRPGISLWVGVGRYPRWNNYYYGYYGGGYNNGYWGPYSYYNTYPGYGYGGYYGGGGYYSGGANRPSSPRPNREGGMGRNTDRIDNPSGGGVTIPNNGRPSRGASLPDRDRTGNDGRISSDRGNTTQPSSTGSSSRPSRTRETSQPRPEPAPTPSSRPTTEYSRPERSYSPPPSSSGSSNDRGGSSSSGSSSSGSRPSRGGR